MYDKLYERIDDLLAMHPLDMFIDPDFLELSDEERELIFLEIAFPEHLPELREECDYDRILQVLDETGFIWHGIRHPMYLVRMKRASESNIDAIIRYNETLLCTHAYLAAKGGLQANKHTVKNAHLMLPLRR